MADWRPEPSLGSVPGTLPPGERPPLPDAASVWAPADLPPGEGFVQTGETVDRSLSFGDTLHEWAIPAPQDQARQAKDVPSGGSGDGIPAREPEGLTPVAGENTAVADGMDATAPQWARP